MSEPREIFVPDDTLYNSFQSGFQTDTNTRYLHAVTVEQELASLRQAVVDFADVVMKPITMKDILQKHSALIDRAREQLKPQGE